MSTNEEQQSNVNATAASATNVTTRPRIVLPKALPIPKPLSEGTAGPAFAALRALSAGVDVERTDGEAALDRIEPLLEAIDEEDVIPRFNVSVRNTAIAALGVLPRILAMRPDAASCSPSQLALPR